MKVAVDTFFLAKCFRHTGTGVYLRNLLRELLRICETNALPVEVHGFVGPDERKWGHEGVISPLAHWHRTGPLGFGRPWLWGGMAVRTASIRPNVVFLPTGQHTIPMPFVPVVTTILDAIPRRLPAAMGGGFGTLHVKTWINAKLATKILTISEWSKRDLVEIYQIEPSNIEVTYLGYDRSRYNQNPPDGEASAGVLKKFGIDRPFIMHHGTLEVRKNITRLIQAWDRLREQSLNYDVQLVLAGPMGHGSEEILQAREASQHREHIFVTGALTDDALAVLIKNASLCVIPSLYEGFCLPLIEAMACGVPTVASNSSCIPEISGGILEYFDPLNIDGMADSIQRALNDSELRQRLSCQGLIRAAEFTWERCALGTLRIFEEAALVRGSALATPNL